MKSIKVKVILTILLVVVLLIIGKIFLFGKKTEGASLRTAVAEMKDLEIIVTASGYIQPVTKVTVGTQVSGIVKKIYVDYNSHVEKGQLLAELDKSTLTEKVLQCQASLNDAESNMLYAQQNYERIKKLYDVKAATEVQLEEATNKFVVAKNAIVNAKANLNQSQVNLSYANIYSPISGKVLSRSVDEGQTVASSFNTPTLFTIANDLTKMQIETDVDEADIGRVQVGQKVSFEVDTYPGEKFSGTVNQVRLDPTVTSNVVTYTVIIDVPNPDEKLFPGMTANVSITTQSSLGVCVMSEALYFTPKQEELQQYVIEDIPSKGNKIWIKEDNVLKAVSVSVGASDGVRSLILSGIKEGDEVVLGIEKRPMNMEKGVNLFPHPGKNQKSTQQGAKAQ